MRLAIIPARGGSKGIIGKNVIKLCGKKLYEYALEAALMSCVDQVVISTDIEEIHDKHPKYALFRPDSISGDDAKMIDVVKHVMSVVPKATQIILLQPTSPLRKYEDINDAFKLFHQAGAKCLYSGYEMGLKTKDSVYDKHLNKPHFQRNGAIFIAKKKFILRTNSMWDKDVIEFKMPASRSIDIDTYEDLFIAKSLIEGGVLKR